MKPDCGTCKAKHDCSAFVDPGTLLCAMNRARAGGTHTDTQTQIIPENDDGCEGCIHVKREENEMPCCNCIRLPKKDWYESE